jgi:hypothetical protein
LRRSQEVFKLLDPESGGVVECYAETFAEIEGQHYLVGYPVDDSVAIAMEQDGEVMPVPVDDELMGESARTAVARRAWMLVCGWHGVHGNTSHSALLLRRPSSQRALARRGGPRLVPSMLPLTQNDFYSLTKAISALER